MNDEVKQHVVDAEIPTETSQFDQIADQQGQPTDPMMAEAMKNLGLQINRCKNLAQAYLSNNKQIPPVLIEAYVNNALSRAELVVISRLLEEKLGVSATDYLKAVTDQLDQMLMLKQMEHKIIITPDGVTNG